MDTARADRAGSSSYTFHKMSKSNFPIEVLITLPLSTPLINKLQDVSPSLRITVHPVKNIDEMPDELWARCEVLYTDRIIPDQEIAPNLTWVQHQHAGIDKTMQFIREVRPNLECEF